MKTFLLVISCACFLYAGYNFIFADKIEYRTCNVTVLKGETLWEIAGRHTEPQEDIREVVFRIAEANQMKSKTVYPGQVLKVPMRIYDSGIMLANK